jgi:hypothetical protein
MTETNQIVFVQEQDCPLYKRHLKGGRHVQMTSRGRKLRVRSVISVEFLFQRSLGRTEETIESKKF